MSDLKRYYDEEMRYLLGAGREYARQFPEAAQVLSIAEVEDRDPYVERLFENFAFLSARLRQSLDNQDDGMAGQLLDQAAPGLESPLPSVAVVEFVPSPDTSETGRLLPRGAQVQTLHLAGLKGPCRFRTARDMAIHPLRLEQFQVGTGSDGQACLDLRLGCIDAVGMVRWPAALEIFLDGEPSTAWTLRHWLVRKARRIEARADGRILPDTLSFAQDLEAGGYSLERAAASQPLLDLRDFLCADERFRFATLRGLDAAVPTGARSVSLRVQFDQPLPASLGRGVDAASARLNCVAVVNAFLEPSVPHLLDPSRTDYPMLVGEENDAEVLEIESFQGFSQSDPTLNHGYLRFSDWRHHGRKAPEAGWYQVHRRPNRSGGVKTGLSVGHPDPGFGFADEYLAGRLWCCDGDRPTELLKPADLREPSTGVPTGLAPQGLTRPTQVFRPPTTPDIRWKLLSHFQRSFPELCDLDNLREVLRLLLWDPRERKRALIDKLVGLDPALGYELVGAVPRPLTRILLTLSDESIRADSWERIGLLDVFAGLVQRLLALRSPQGSRLVLTLRVLPAGLEWEHAG